ncbi:MAG: hypothetical protein WBO12_01885, partial [Xanthobacteraceae bacterium]|jgi:hypothetical protein
MSALPPKADIDPSASGVPGGALQLCAKSRHQKLVGNVSSSKPQRFCDGLARAKLAAQDPVYASTIDLVAFRKSGLPALAFNGCS